MSAMRFDLNKTKYAVLYLLRYLNKGRRDIHSVFKALYFAEKYHFGQHGKSFVGDGFISMEYGPVPSVINNWTGESWELSNPVEDSIIMQRRIDSCATSDSNPEELTESETAALDEAISVIHGAGPTKMNVRSFDEAYNFSLANTTVIYIKLAEASGANEDEIKFMLERFEVPEAFADNSSALDDSFPKPVSNEDPVVRNLHVSADLS